MPTPDYVSSDGEEDEMDAIEEMDEDDRAALDNTVMLDAQQDSPFTAAGNNMVDNNNLPSLETLFGARLLHSSRPSRPEFPGQRWLSHCWSLDNAHAYDGVYAASFRPLGLQAHCRTA
jgi:hypothetical protein